MTGAGACSGRTQGRPPQARKLIERNRHELAVMESLDSGKPVPVPDG